MPTTPEGTEVELRDYLQTLRRRKWIVISAAVVVTASTLMLSFLQVPVYQAKAVLLVRPQQADTLFNPNTGQRNDPQRNLDTEIQILKSAPVRDAVRKQIGDVPKISASAIGQTDTFNVVASSTIPGQAARIADAYAQAYIDLRRTQNVSNLLSASSQIQSQITDLQREIDVIDKQISAEPAAQRAAGNDSLSVQRNALVDQKSLFSQKLQELKVSASVMSGGAQLATPAAVPTSPSSPKPIRNGVLALVVGLLFGVGVAFLTDYLDDSIKTRDDLERTLCDLPVLGLIPSVPNWRNQADPLVISASEPRSEAAESYRALRTSIQFMGLDRPMRTLEVTSPSASEGKSTTLANLAVALARAGQRVIVVCCDLRRPRIHEFFALGNAVGFTSVLLGEVPLSAAVQDVPGEPRLRLLASGPIPPNPSELLSGQRAVEVLTALQTEADIVLVDAPPVLPVTDAAVLSARVDAVLLVATAGRTTRRAIRHAVETLGQVEAPVVGVVLNRVPEASTYGYQYGYSYAGSAYLKHTEAATPRQAPITERRQASSR